ncbi:MAG: TIGR00270 family protein, partial [Thermoprotei archaeon]
MCGTEIAEREARKVLVDNATLIVCPRCYEKLVKSRRIESTSITAGRKSIGLASSAGARVSSGSRSIASSRPQLVVSQRRRTVRRVEENYELVDDYAERIRRARERLGWSQKVLALKVKESENTIKRIESGKLRPTIELARKLEEVLSIKLLEPAVDKLISDEESGSVRLYATLGEVVN